MTIKLEDSEDKSANDSSQKSVAVGERLTPTIGLMAIVAVDIEVSRSPLMAVELYHVEFRAEWGVGRVN